MADVVVSKQVFFIGAWRTPKVTEHLLQQISQQMFHKEGYSTILNLTNDGLYLNISNINGQTTKTDRIPLELMADFINNKHSPTNTCLLAMVKDGQNQYTVFVFLCRNEKDSAAMVQEYQKLKSKLRGEGYNLDMKQPGTNWTLKNKDTDEVISQPNGDVHVITTTTTTTTNGIPDSVSRASMSSDVREEINELAKEVRDIRLMMQKSGGRQHFAKHYGYLSSPPPTQTSVSREVFTEQVVVPPSPVNDVNFVKRQYAKRTPEPNVLIVRGRSGQYRQRQSTSGHFIRAGSTSSLASTVRRRVYPSPNPMADARYALPKHHDTVRLVSGGPQPVMLRNSRSDIVHKDIENVYKSRKVFRRIIPVGPVAPVRSETYDYVQSHQREVIDDDIPVEPVRSVYVDNSPPKVVKRSALHIKYDPNERNLYENTTFHQQVKNESNVSTLVNVSSNNLLDDTLNVQDFRKDADQTQKVIIVNGDSAQVRNEYADEAVTTQFNESHESSKVFVVRGDDNLVKDLNQTGQENENVYYVKSGSVFNDPEQVIAGGVYHVKAKGLENLEGAYYEVPDEPGVVVTERTDYDDLQPSTSNVTVIRTKTNDVSDVNNVGDVNEGLWGAYAKEPEPFDPNQQIEKEKAFRYTDDENEIKIESIEVVSNEINSEMIPDEMSTEDIADRVENVADEVEAKRVHYAEDLTQTIDDKVIDNVEDSNIGRELDDVLSSEPNGIVKDVVDDFNNNAADQLETIKKTDIDIDGTKGSVLNELKDRFAQEPESSVLF